MPRKQTVAAMTRDDERLAADAERELTRLLAVEPSAEFIARTRARIAVSARPPARRVMRWGYLAAVAAAAVFAVGLALSRQTADETRSPAAIVTAVPPASVAPSPDVDRAPEDGAVRTTSRKAAGARPGASARTARSAQPAVLVPAERRRAIDRLIAMVQEGRLADAPVAVEPAAEPSPEWVPPLVVHDLNVPAIAGSAEYEEGTGTTEPGSPNN